jgi:integrase
LDKARKLLQRRLVEKEDERLPAKSKERKRTVDALLDELVKDYTARKKRSATKLWSHLKWLRKELGNQRAGSVSKSDLTQYILDRRAAGAAESSIKKDLQLLGQAYNLQTAVPKPQFPQRPKSAVRDRLVAPSEQARLIAAFDDETYRDVARFYFATGWRGLEIRSLRWEDVRHESGVIHLVEEFSKNGEPRDFPLTGRVAEVIARREAERLPFCPYVFHRGDGKQVVYRTWLKKWKWAAIKAGLGTYDRNRMRFRYQGISPHDARRSFCTEAMNAVGDSQIVRTLSGHKSNTIFERYRIVRTETLARAIEMREEYVATKEPSQTAKVVVLAEHRNSHNVALKSHNSGDELPKAHAEWRSVNGADNP